MAKKRRAKSPNKRLQIRLQMITKPARMKPKQYLQALLKAVDTLEMPRGLDVQLHWRNPDTLSGRSRHWQQDEFLSAVESSSAGFSGLLKKMIRRRLIARWG